MSDRFAHYHHESGTFKSDGELVYGFTTYQDKADSRVFLECPRRTLEKYQLVSDTICGSAWGVESCALAQTTD